MKQKGKSKVVYPPKLKSCLVCGGPLKLKRITLRLIKKKQIYILEGVPALFCDGCNEVWVLELLFDEFKNRIKSRSGKYDGRRKR